MTIKHDTYTAARRQTKELGACLAAASLERISATSELAMVTEAIRLLRELSDTLADRLEQVSTHVHDQRLARLKAAEQAETNQQRRERRLRVLDQPPPSKAG